MAGLNVSPSGEHENSIKQPEPLPLRAISRAAGDLERYKVRVLQLYARHNIQKICEILRREDRIIVSGKMLREALQQWHAFKAIKSENKKYLIGLRRRRQREGRATAIRYSVLSPSHVSKQLDRFIAENDIHESEQIEWESLAGPFPEEIYYATPKRPENYSNRREESLTPTAEEHLQDQVLLEATRVSVAEQQKVTSTARSPWACISAENQMFKLLDTNLLSDLERRALQLHEKHFGKIKYNWRNIDRAAEKLWSDQRFKEAEELDQMAIELAENHWGSNNEDTLVLKANLASTLWTQGRYNEAGQLEIAVVNSAEASQGLDSEDTLWYKDSLSTTLRTQGKLEEAKTLSLEVVRRATKVLGENHNYTLLFKVNLARIYNTLSQWVEAKKLLVMVTASREKIWGFSDKRTLQAYILLGSVFQSLELWDEAKAVNKDVESEIVRSVYPNTLLWTLEFMDNLAVQFFGLGQYFEAEAIFRELALQRERLLSARHPQTLGSTIAIATCLHYQNKPRHAMEIGQHVLHLVKEVLGDDHPHTLTVMANLTWYEYETLNMHEFVSRMTEVYRLRQAKLGNNNPETVRSKLFIAWGQCRRGKFEEAQGMYDSAHAHLIKIHGSENHIDVIKCVQSKAQAFVVSGQDHEAERLQRKAHGIMEKIRGERHISSLINTKHLIGIISRLGRYNEAEEMASKITSIISDILGSHHPQTMEFLKITADIYIGQREWAKVTSLYARILKAYEPYGEQHPYVISAKINLAEALSWFGQSPEAEKLLQSALNSAKQAFDLKKSEFAWILALAAKVKKAQLKYSDAEELYRQTLEARKEFLGKMHPKTLTNMDNLALVLEKKGKYGEAEVLYQQVLKVREKNFGKKHIDALKSRSDLAIVFQAQGRYRDAEELHRQTLQEREDVLGQKHLDTLKSRSNLARVFKAQGRFRDAERLHRQTLREREEVLGKKHLHTLLSLSELALAFGCQRNYEAAEALQREALTGLKEVLGTDHQDTIDSMQNLSLVLYYRRKYSEGQEIILEVLDKRRVLGEEHPSYLVSVGILAEILQAQSQFDKAERLFLVELNGLEKALGKEHPNTRRSFNNLTHVRKARQGLL